MRRRSLAMLLFAAASRAAFAASAEWPDPASLARPAGRAPPTLRITVDYPPADAVLPGDQPGYLSGLVLPPGVEPPRRDVVVVIDVSESTLAPLRDPFQDSAPPENAPDGAAPLGSILDAEVAAVHRLLRTLDPARTRVAIVSFSGSPAWDQSVPVRWRDWRDSEPAAHTWIGLTNDFAAAERALDAVAAAGGRGLTHMAAGVERATAELVGGPGGSSTPDPRAHPTILFMSDGVPSLPEPRSRLRYGIELLAAAQRAAVYGIRIHCFAIGEMALRGPFSIQEMAARTGGTFAAVADPASLPDRIPLVPLEGVAAVEVRNLTSGEAALATDLRVDGSFDSLVPLAPGANRVEIRARAQDGREARLEVAMRSAQAEASGAAAEPAALPDHLLKRRGAIAEKAAQEQREAPRRALVEEMQRERAAAGTEPSDGTPPEQRRELELEVERRRGVGAGPEPER